MTPEQTDPTFADLPDHFRTLPLVLGAAEAFLKVAEAAGIALDGTLSQEALEAVGTAIAAHTLVNSITFASTGGDGVHFGLLLSASTTARDGVVVMTVPMAERANHVIAGSIREFLGLGCVHGWFSLEQLATARVHVRALRACGAAKRGPDRGTPTASRRWETLFSSNEAAIWMGLRVTS